VSGGPAAAFSLAGVGGDGPVLLCVHGLTGTPFDVRPSQALLDELKIACAGPLLPGHGTSVAQLARTTHAEWIDAVVSAFDALAATHVRVYVLGLSLGGLLALELCARRAVSGALVLAAPLGLGWVRAGAVRALAPFVHAVPRRAYFADPLVALELDHSYRQMPLRAVRELMKLQRLVRASLPAVRTPLRLLYSRSDPTVSFADAERLRRLARLADVRIQYLERSGHILTRDVDREFVATWICEQLRALEADLGRG
jgi:carboxylesterase